MTEEEKKILSEKYTLHWDENFKLMRSDPDVGNQFLIESAKRIHGKGTKRK